MHNILANLVSVEWIIYIASFGLILTGLFIVFTDKNLIKIIIGLDMAETGVNILIVAAGYIKGNTAPIFSKASLTPAQMTDPVPQALVLTSIVIGFGVTALALALVVRLYQKTGSLDVSKIRGLKW
ncbi:MAG: cation:proton antiporter [Spirochaetes bacterium]|nr:MAG: cation:proton antiporter [Spirochaetota bacterium]